MLTGAKKVRSTAAFLWACWKLNLAGAMEFRISFLMAAGLMIVNNFVWIFFWSIFFGRFDVVNGWTLQDVMMLWAVSAGGYGIAATLFGNITRLSTMVATGQLDVYLALPKPVLLHALASRMSVSAIGDATFSALLYLMFGDRTWLGFAKYALAHLVAATVFLFFMVIIHSLAFWIGNAEGLSGQMLNAMLSFSTYPTDIFKGIGRIVVFTAVPAGFISYMPIGLMRGAVQIDFLLDALGMALLLAVFGTWFFYRGLARYSSGNMTAMRS